MKPVTPKASKGLTWLVACGALVGAFEGCDLTAKVDTIGTGHPVTWCHGETIAAPGTTVHVGEHFTKAECDAMLDRRLPQYWGGIAPCINVETSDNEKIAYTSFAYNEGSGRFCGSAMVRDLNAGNHQGACEALLAYDISHPNGPNRPAVHFRGLELRRLKEEKVCLTPDDVLVNRAAIIPKVTEKPFEAPPPPVAAPASPPVKAWAHWYSKFLSRDWWMEA